MGTAGQHAGVVPSASLNFDRFASPVHRLAWRHDRGHGLEPDPQDDVLAVADAALDAAAAVGGGADSVASVHEGVVVLRAAHQGAAQARAHSKDLVAGSDHMALAKSAWSRSNTGSPQPLARPRHEHHGASHGVACLAHLLNALGHAARRVRDGGTGLGGRPPRLGCGTTEARAC